MTLVRLAFIPALLLTMLAHAQQAGGPTPDHQAQMQALAAARQMAQAVIMYGSTNSTMPADVRVLFGQGILGASMGAPNDDGSAIVLDGVAYGYLGVGGVSTSEVPDWSEIAIGYRSLDHPFAIEPNPHNPEGAVVPVAFLDGHVEMLSPAETRWLIDESRRTLTALRDGAPMPLYHQIKRDASRLAQAMIAFAAAHDGLAPPDWASTFEHLRANPKGEGESDADRLRMYLSPKSRENTFIPAFQSDAERDAWINANSMWRSDAHGANLWRVPNPMFTVLLSSRPDAWVQTPDRRLREHVRKLAFATVDARGDLADRALLEARARDAQDLYESLRGGAPLPPLDDAMHDLRTLSRAITAYARDNKGYMPADLGDVVPYLKNLWGVDRQQPARVFLIRADETELAVRATPDAQWVREHGSYVYLGDPTVRLRDLRGSGAGILVHAPIDRPFGFIEMGENRPRVPFAGPLLSAIADPADWRALPLFMFPPGVLEEQAAASRAAILKLSQQ